MPPYVVAPMTSSPLVSQRQQILLELLSPKSLLLLIGIGVVIVEVTIMPLLHWTEVLPPVLAALFDSAVLILTISVLFYLVYYRPLKLYNNQFYNSLNSDLVADHAPAGLTLKELEQLTPRRLLPLMILAIFVAETGVMFLLAQLPPIPVSVEAFLDASGLLLFLSPTFYYFHYRPLQQQYLARQRATEQLLASEERLQLALQATNDCLWDYDISSGNIYLSSRGMKMLGYSAGEIKPTISVWQEHLHPDEKDEILTLLNEHLEGKSDHYSAEYRIRTKSREWLWVLARGQVVTRDQNFAPLRMVGTYTDISQRKAAEERLRQSEEEIRTLSHKLIHSSEEEKKHLALDLHDEFGQVLTAFQLGVEMVRDHRYQDEREHHFQCDRLLGMVDRLEKDLRQICDHLRPVMLDDVGLEETLRWHIRELTQFDKNVEVDFRVFGRAQLNKEIEIVLYRICQEALNNVAKHAAATQVTVTLNLADEQVELSVQDNGCGVADNSLCKIRHSSWGMGLLGMRERAVAVGGHLAIESEQGKGTCIKVVVPVKEFQREF